MNKQKWKIRLGDLLLTVFLCMLHVDAFFIACIQTWIVDPLQFRGVSLLTQVRVCASCYLALYTLSVAQHPAIFQVVCLFVVFCFWLQVILLPDSRYWERLTPSSGDRLTLNYHMFDPLFIGLRLVVSWANCMTILIGLSIRFGHILDDATGAIFILLLYLDACQPKPPRPKKERIWITTNGMAEASS